MKDWIRRLAHRISAPSRCHKFKVWKAPGKLYELGNVTYVSLGNYWFYRIHSAVVRIRSGTYRDHVFDYDPSLPHSVCCYAFRNPETGDISMVNRFNCEVEYV